MADGADQEAALSVRRSAGYGVMRAVVFALALLAAGSAYADDLFPPTPARDPSLPDPYPTPGVVNPDVTQDNIGETICKANWTKTIRPPNLYFAQLKAQQLGIPLKT